MTPAKTYYILCTRHSRSDDPGFTWWGPNRSGYTCDLDKAGIYTEEEAQPWLTGHSEDVAIPVEEVLALPAMRVVPMDGKFLDLVRTRFTDCDHYAPEKMREVDAALRMESFGGDDETCVHCPWCGKQDEDWYHDKKEVAKPGDKWPMECGYCGKPFAVEVTEMSLEFRTARMGVPETKEEPKEDER